MQPSPYGLGPVELAALNDCIVLGCEIILHHYMFLNSNLSYIFPSKGPSILIFFYLSPKQNLTVLYLLEIFKICKVSANGILLDRSMYP